MRTIANKTDNSTDRWTAAAFNSLMSELENIIISAGITLDQDAGPDTNINMLGQAIASYAGNIAGYRESGTANSYILNPKNNLIDVTEYYDGMAVLFVVGNTNTGASVIKIDNLAEKAIVDNDGNALTANILVQDDFVILVYDETNDRFEWGNKNPEEFIASVAEAIAGTISNKGITPAGFVRLLDTGSIHLYGNVNPPVGLLSCNGAQVSKTTYNRLYDVIGSTYGTETGTTFQLPNLTSPINNTIYVIKT